MHRASTVGFFVAVNVVALINNDSTTKFEPNLDSESRFMYELMGALFSEYIRKQQRYFLELKGMQPTNFKGSIFDQHTDVGQLKRVQ